MYVYFKIIQSKSHLISSTNRLIETSNPIGSVSSKNRGSDSLLNGASQLIQFFQASSSRSVGKLWLMWVLDCRTYENKNQLRSQDIFETKHSYWNKKHVFKWFTPKINRICSKSPHIQYFLRLAQPICYHTMVIPPKKKCIHLLKQNKHHPSNPQLYPPSKAEPPVLSPKTLGCSIWPMTIRTEAFSTCENAASAEEMLEIKIYIYIYIDG